MNNYVKEVIKARDDFKCQRDHYKDLWEEAARNGDILRRQVEKLEGRVQELEVILEVIPNKINGPTGLRGDPS